MTFRDPELRQHYERATILAFDCAQEELPVVGLLDASQWFSMKEGEDSPRVAEALEHLLSPGLRPALREWYRRWGFNMNREALNFRDRLSKLAGEEFG